MIRYVDTLEGIELKRLRGFFVGWPTPPAPDTHWRVLTGSDAVVIAIDDRSSDVVGFVTAITDGVLSVYIPFLEVLPAHRRQGVGRELMRRMLRCLSQFYMVDLLCDPELQPFYSALGMQRCAAMMARNYKNQSGLPQ